MVPRVTRHLVLLVIGVAWAVLSVHSLEYLGRFMFHTFLVSVRWIQWLFIALSLYAGVLFLLSLRWRPATRPIDAVRPYVSLLIPAKDEDRVIEGTLRSLARLDYHAGERRRYEILVIDDGSSDETPHVLERLRRELGVHVVRTSPGGRGKAAALNVGTRQAHGDLLAVFDADARVAPDCLQRLVARLDDPRVAGAQGRRLPYNPGQNLLTRMQDDEFAIFSTAFARAREAVGGFVTFAGNGLLVRRTALEAAGGWNEEALTEDIDLSVRLYLQGWRIRYCDEAVIGEEAVPGVGALIRQRTRWFEGALRCLGEQLPALLVARLPLLLRLDMLFFLSGFLLATLALLTTYVYALIDLVGAVVVFLGVPRGVMTAISLFFTLGLLAAIVDIQGWRPFRLAGIVLRSGVLSLHRLVVVPFAIARYVHAAVTGRVDWAKTAHLGAMSAEGAGDGPLP